MLEIMLSMEIVLAVSALFFGYMHQHGRKEEAARCARCA